MQNRENYTVKMFRFYMIADQYLSLNEILLGFNLLFTLQGLGENEEKISQLFDTCFSN